MYIISTKYRRPTYITPGPLYNTIHYNMVLDITLISVGSQLHYFCYMYMFIHFTRYNTDWIANMETGLEPSNSVIKRLRFISIKCSLLWNILPYMGEAAYVN